MKTAQSIWHGMGLKSLLLISAAVAAAAAVDESKLPKPSDKTIDFDRDIRPIFEASCYQCHGPEKPKSSFRLDNRESALKGGENGISIIPGSSAKSPLIHSVAGLHEEFDMPPKGKAPALTSEQVGLLRAWIDQGAKWPEGSSVASNKYLFSLTPSVQFITVNGNERKFREHMWMREGWSGGAQSFHFQDVLTNGTKVDVQGRALAQQNDYQVKISIEKNDLGFTRFGYEQYRKYYGDDGLYNPNDPDSPYFLNRDLHLDHGRAWFEAGLTLPDWPKMTVGYEYQFKQGSSASLNYDRGNIGTALVPEVKDINEKVHIVKFDLDHEIKGVRIEDNFRGEFYDLKTTQTRGASSSYDRENDSHFVGANVIKAEKQLRDWLFLSGGYLFSSLDGQAGFVQDLFTPPSPTVTGIGDLGTGILLERIAHVLNANAMLGPWEGLSFVTGIQSEWNRQKGMGWGSFYGSPLTPYNGNLSKFITEENFGLRYTKIPFTVLYADTRFVQESIGRFESQTRGNFDANDFVSDIESSTDLKEFKTGATISPWQKVIFGASYRYRDKLSNYDPRVDFDLSPIPGNGYPGFIRSRELRGDEIELRAVVRPVNWLKTTMRYQLGATDYRTTTTSYDDGFGTIIPGGTIHAGNYDAHTWSINNTLTPWRRLYLSCTLSYTTTRTSSGVENGVQIVPYQGNIYSVLSSANFVLNDKTDLHATYTFDQADYGQNNFAGGFPVGITYSRHGVMGGITRRFKKFITTGLQYGFFRYDEPTANGANNYVAHAIIGTLTMNLP